jgi:hypothetical protein
MGKEARSLDKQATYAMPTIDDILGRKEDPEYLRRLDATKIALSIVQTRGDMKLDQLISTADDIYEYLVNRKVPRKEYDSCAKSGIAKG